MATSFNYSVANGTLNGVVSTYSLTKEIQASTITIALDNISITGDVLSVVFKFDISAAEQTTLNGIVASHTGEELIITDKVDIQNEPAFASKYTSDGKSLFKRVHGTSGVLVPPYDANDEANTIKTITFVIPYPEAKFSGATILGTSLGDLVDFTVHDSDTGIVSQTLSATGYTAIPDLQLNQFGFSVVMTDGFYSNTSNYDASMVQGLKLKAKIKNMSGSNRTYYMNVELHEVK